MATKNGRNSSVSLSKNDEAIKVLEKHLQRLMHRPHLKHAVLAVETMDGSFRWMGARGAACPDGTPMKPAIPFWIASVTKLFIAAAVLKLQEKGLLSLGDSILIYLPENLVRGLHRIGGVDCSKKITILNLLEHSSGMPDYLEVRKKGAKSLLSALLEDGDRWVSTEDIVTIIKESGSALFPPQPLEAGKKKIRYSDTNYQLLIAVIENVSGQPLHRVLEDIIFRLLGLKETFFPGTDPVGAFPEVTSVWYKDQELRIPEAMTSLKDLYSTAGDLIAFRRALLQGKLFSHPSPIGLTSQGWNRFGFYLSSVSPGWPIEYGLGMMRFRLSRLMTPIVSVPEIIGHTGVCGSWLFYCPKIDILLAGTVSQITAAAVPFRFLPRLLIALRQYFSSSPVGPES